MRRLLVASVLLASFSVAAMPPVSQAAPLSKPVVTVQPTDRTAQNDEPPILRSKATGNPTPTVVWEASLDGGKTFTAGTGADYTKDDLDLRKVIADSIGKENLWYLNGARFRATYTNSQGTATTDTITLTVLFRPKLFFAVQDQSVTVGQMAKFEAACAGNPKPTVQWQVKVVANHGRTLPEPQWPTTAVRPTQRPRTPPPHHSLPMVGRSGRSSPTSSVPRRPTRPPSP